MYHRDAVKRRVFGRRLTNVGLAVVLAIAIASPVLTPARPVHATTPPGPCEPWEDGNRIALNGVWYECRCRTVSGGTDVLCVWVQVSKNALQANANGDYVSTELGYTGSYYAMLRARAFSIGSWEQYSLGGSGDSDGTWALRSTANQRYVTAEFGFSGSNNGILEAQATVIGSWEKYYLYQIGSQYAFQSFLPPNSTCCYVSTEIGYGGSEYGVLRARAFSVGSWEKYWIIGLGGFSPLSSTGTTATVARDGPVSSPTISFAKTEPCPAWLAKKVNTTTCKKLIPATP